MTEDKPRYSITSHAKCLYNREHAWQVEPLSMERYCTKCGKTQSLWPPLWGVLLVVMTIPFLMAWYHLKCLAEDVRERLTANSTETANE